MSKFNQWLKTNKKNCFILKSTAMGHLEPTTTINTGDPDPLFYDWDSDSGPENLETDVEFFTHRAPARRVITVKINQKIHDADIERFLHFGFDEQLYRLANRSGFQVRSYKQLKHVVKAMRASAMNRAKAEIKAQEREDVEY
ncbi:hypothetical protein EDD22DRAFT_847268 [Suillus occidentalis]|nr:hypothetical protein EDD22DRAFT_847268 [Suillus occidentalis]